MYSNTYTTIFRYSFSFIILVCLTSKISAQSVSLSSNFDLDKVNPIISCPSDITIKCSQNLYNYELLGQPSVSNNQVTIERIDSNNLNNCGVGTITRVWNAVDQNGVTSTCVQTITAINKYPFDENDIIYPLDLTTTECATWSLNPDYLSQPYARPILNKDACDKVVVNYEDTYVSLDGPACFSILRKWTVINKCANASNDQPRTWEHTQTIKVIDFNPPTFVSLTDEIIKECYESNCDATYVDLITQAEDCSPYLSYTYQIDLFSDGSINHTGTSNDASGTYPVGNHKISFTASDGCGNKETCSFNFRIKNTEKIITKR